MSNLISFNPQLTTSPLNTFQVETEGYVQGSYFDDPSTRQWLLAGQLASTVAQPIWGGMSISEMVNAPNTNQGGNTLELAAAYASLTGFTVSNQANNMVIVPGNSAQIAVAGMSMNYFRLGSNARIQVLCDSTLAAALDAGLTNQQVSWDFTNQKLIAFSTTALPVKVLSVNTNSKVISYNSGTGAVSWVAGTCAVIQI